MRRICGSSLVRVLAMAAGTAGAWLGGPGVVAAQTTIPERLSLQEAVTLAVERNPAMVAARAGVDAAEGDRLAASRRPNPALSIDSAGYPTFESVRPGYWGGQEFTVRFDQELETSGRRRLRTVVAEAGRATAQLVVEDRARQVGRDVRIAYLTAVLAEADRTVAQTSLDEIDRVIALNRARLQQGEISGAELRRLQVERLRFVEDVFAGDLALKNARSALLALLSAPRLDQPLELTDGLKAPAGRDTLGAAPVDVTERPRLLERALDLRPDLLAARREQAQAETSTRLQRALRTPNITVGGGYQNNFGSDGVVVGVTLPLPFFNRNQGGIARADAERRAADARADATAIAVRLDVQRALNAVETNRARVDYIEQEYLTNAQQSRDIVLESYRLGVANLIDFLDAQRAFRDTQRTYNRALFDQRVSLFELAAAVGRPDVQP
ncbi:MAG: TolC family protein [Acidobacteria bacterium]|nr:TolC family protein [Acidobacteriota bacterium]